MTTTVKTSPIRPVAFSADPALVREFAAANGFEVGSRGRFSADLIKAFNEGKKGSQRYVSGKRPSRHVVTVSVTKEDGKSKAVRVDVTKARAYLTEQGVAVPVRGRLSMSLLIQAAAAFA